MLVGGVSLELPLWQNFVFLELHLLPLAVASVLLIEIVGIGRAALKFASDLQFTLGPKLLAALNGPRNVVVSVSATSNKAALGEDKVLRERSLLRAGRFFLFDVFSAVAGHCFKLVSSKHYLCLGSKLLAPLDGIRYVVVAVSCPLAVKFTLW